MADTNNLYQSVEKKVRSVVERGFNNALLLYCTTGSLARHRTIAGWSDIDIMIVYDQERLTHRQIQKIIQKALIVVKQDIKIGITIFSQCEFLHMKLLDVKSCFNVLAIRQGKLRPQILDTKLVFPVINLSSLKHRDFLQLPSHLHKLRRALIEKKNEREIYKLAVTIAKILIFQKRGITLSSGKDIWVQLSRIFPSLTMTIAEPEEIMSPPEKIQERFTNYEKFVDWIISIIDKELELTTLEQ